MTGFQRAHALHPDAIYIDRECDAELLKCLLTGRHCHVLAPRQVGKSSLLQRTLRRLREAHADKIAAVRFTVTAIGTTTVTAEAWCAELTRVIAGGVSAPDAAVYPAPGKSPLAALRSSLDRIAATIAPRRLVLALDEVDAFHEMKFGYDLLQMLRARISDDDATPITLCFIGAMRPEEIIRAGEDLDRTPFQRMQKVFVRDFERAELGPFAMLLAGLGERDPEAILAAVYAQTSGHPAMTQHLCDALVNEPERDGPADVRVARVVEDEFFQPGNRDHLMRDVDGRFAKPEVARVGRMLSRYQVVLIEGARRAAPGEEADAVLDGLRVAGLVSLTSDGVVRARNRIFARVFDRAWVEQRLSDRRPFAPEMSRWLQQRSRSLLLDGELLDKAMRWRAAHPELAPEETAFIDASVQESFRRRGRWFSTLAAIAVVSAGVALGASVLYFGSREAQTRAEANAAAERVKAEEAQVRAARETAQRVEAERLQRVAEAGDRAHQDRNRCQGELGDAGVVIAALDGANVRIGDRLSVANAQVGALDAALATTSAALASTRAEANALDASLALSVGRLDATTAQVNTLDAALTQCQEGRDAATQQVEALDAAVEACRRDLADASGQIAALGAELNAARANAQALDAALAECRAQQAPPVAQPNPPPPH